MKTIKKYQCEICKTEYNFPDLAKLCESDDNVESTWYVQKGDKVLILTEFEGFIENEVVDTKTIITSKLNPLKTETKVSRVWDFLLKYDYTNKSIHECKQLVYLKDEYDIGDYYDYKPQHIEQKYCININDLEWHSTPLTNVITDSKLLVKYNNGDICIITYNGFHQSFHDVIIEEWSYLPQYFKEY